MLYSGIIKEGEKIELGDKEIIKYIKNYIESYPEVKINYERFIKGQMVVSDYNLYEFVVRVLGWIIIDKATIHYPDNAKDFDKLEYLLSGCKLKKLQRFVLKGERFIPYVSPVEQEIRKIGFSHANSPENELSFWYPKTANIGFKTPDTLITPLTDDEFGIIKSANFKDFNHLELLKRIREIAASQNFDLNRDLFLRFGCSSNKFNFDACHIPDLEFLPDKLSAYFENIFEKLEWKESAEIVLREFIKTDYYRRQIYNGMPLNTEFRVFFDFDTNEILGIYNYWDKETMLDNLHKQDDCMAFAHTTPLLEKDFNRLAPYLEDEAKKKLPNADMQGKWSIDFMYDGSRFVLIDMAHAECSYYYEKVVEKQLAYQNK